MQLTIGNFIDDDFIDGKFVDGYLIGGNFIDGNFIGGNFTDGCMLTRTIVSILQFIGLPQRKWPVSLLRSIPGPVFVSFGHSYLHVCILWLKHSLRLMRLCVM